MMDQFRELSLSHLACSIPEYEKERVDGVGFAGTVWADDCAEGLSNRIMSQLVLDTLLTRTRLRTLWNGPISCLPA